MLDWASQHRTLRFFPLTGVFNLHHAELFYPSWQINVRVDESMSALRGKDGTCCSDGLPLEELFKKPP